MRLYSAFLAVTLLLSVPAGALAQGAPSLPPAARLYGSVTVNGLPADAGIVVTVMAANGATCGTNTVGAAPASGSSYVVDLTGSDSGCNTAGESLSFTVGSSNATASSDVTVPSVSDGVRADLSVAGPP